MGTASIWLPPYPNPLVSSPEPSFTDIKPNLTRLLSVPLDEFLFKRLPTLLNAPFNEVKWHYNVLCQGCPFENECSERSVREGKVGAMSGISIQDAQVLEDFINMTDVRKDSPELTDIECLDQIVRSKHLMARFRRTHPSIVKKSERILKIPKRRSEGAFSAVIDAAKTRTLRVSATGFVLSIGNITRQHIP
jgi:hypothetical protein